MIKGNSKANPVSIKPGSEGEPVGSQWFQLNLPEPPMLNKADSGTEQKSILSVTRKYWQVVFPPPELSDASKTQLVIFRFGQSLSSRKPKQ